MLEELVAFVRKSGGLSQALPHFQERAEQVALLEKVASAFLERKVALLEAGTGVGKSFAYLLPALFMAHIHQKKVAIATHTIHLQEQLLKDLPLLLKTLKWDLSVSLVLGMGNYLCLKKEKESVLAPQWHAFAQRTTTGRFGDSKMDRQTWERVKMDPDTCVGRKCPYYKECFFFKDRKKAEDSQILLMNHHLLVKDLWSKKLGTSYLPKYDYVVIDEGHHFEKVARESLALTCSQKEMFKLFQRLTTEKGKGRVDTLEQKLQKEPMFKVTYHHLKDAVAKEGADFFSQLDSLYPPGVGKCRLKGLKGDKFKEVVVKAGSCVAHMKKLREETLALLEEPDEAFKQTNVFLLHEIRSIVARLDDIHACIERIFLKESDPNRVEWIESSLLDIQCISADLDMSTLLQQILFQPLASVVILSATLSVAKDFTPIKQRLGIEKATVEAVFDSPFDWKKQALFLGVEDLPDPESELFQIEAASLIQEAIAITRGNALILFTSYTMLNRFYEALEKPLVERGYALFKQGMGSRKQLIESFKQTKRSVLFGTDSFWEGVDIRGKDLQLVVMTKLPFQVPTDPITEAISDRLKLAGKSPFFDHQIPLAVTKFKQGFGRLIRHHYDVGAVVSLDARLFQKSYGKKFLQSLPPCSKACIPQKQLSQVLKTFFHSKKQ